MFVAVCHCHPSLTVVNKARNLHVGLTCARRDYSIAASKNAMNSNKPCIYIDLMGITPINRTYSICCFTAKVRTDFVTATGNLAVENTIISTYVSDSYEMAPILAHIY